MEELDSGCFIGEHKYCIANEFPIKSNGQKRRACSSSDALAIYEHEGHNGGIYYDATCFSCMQGFTKDEVHKSSLAKDLGIDTTGCVTKRPTFVNKSSKKLKITRKERDELWSKTGWEANGYRGLSNEILEFYGHRTELDSSGNVIAQYYPETEDGVLMGYKSKHNPKVYPKKYGKGNLGRTGSMNDLSGQHKFPDGGRYALIVGGEDDKIAAQVMLRSYQKQKGMQDYNHYSVVAPTTGEPSAAKQCRRQYDWLNLHDVIVIGMDNDEAGREAAEEIAKVLPKEKVRIASWSCKDPNEMLNSRKERQFLSDFFGAKEYIKSGIIGSDELEDAIFEELSLEKIPLPPFMSKLQKHMAGGIPLGYIINLIANTGCGKTTIANECVYHWIFNSPHKIGIISLELDTGQYGLSLLSRHLGNKLQLYEDQQEVVNFLNQPDIISKRKKLWINELGERRFYLLDDRDGDLKTLKDKIEQMIVQYQCKFLIIDPLQDALDGYSNEDQSVFMKWMKQLVKRYKVSFFNVNHVRKESTTNVDRFLKEDDVQGASAIVKSAGCNIIFTRDKLAEDDISKNVTKVFIPKCRWTGSTGDGGLWYYSLEQHTLYDLEEYFTNNPDKVPVDTTLTEILDNQRKIHNRDKKKEVKDKPSNDHVFNDGTQF